MKTLLIFATPSEAAHLLEIYPSNPQTAHFFSSELFDILITGMGAYRALSRLQSHLDQHTYSRAINLGCAAHLNRAALGECFTVHSCIKILEQPEPIDHSRSFFNHLFPPIELAPLPGFLSAALGSIDCPLHNAEISSKLASHIDLVDMEGYALAWVAMQRSLPFHAVKCISDFGDGSDPQVIRRTLATSSRILAEAVGRLVAL